MTQKRWAGGSPYDMLDRRLRFLGLTMLISAIVDVILALSGLLFPQWVGAALGLSGYGLLPLVHLIFPCFGVLAWMDTKRNVAIVTGAIVARVLYALFALFALLDVATWGWAVLGGLSLAWAVSHYVFLRLSDFGFWEVFSRAGSPPSIERR